MSESMGEKRDKSGGWRTVWALGVAQAVDAGETNIVSTMFPSIGRTLGLNAGHLGTVLAMRQLLGLFARPVWSMLSDRYSRKAILVWITGVWGVWTLLVGFSDSYRHLLVLTILSGLGLYAHGGAKQSLIADHFPEEDRGKAFGTIWVIAAAGTFIGSLVFGTLAQVSDASWRTAYWVFGGLSVLSGALVWWLVDEPARGQSEAALADAVSGVAEEMEAQHPFALRKVPALLKIPTLWTSWVGYIAGAFQWVGAVRFGTTWMADERGLSPGMATYGIGALIVGLGLGGFVGGRVGDRLDRWNPSVGRIFLGHLAKVGAVIAAYLLFRTESTFYLTYWALLLFLGLSIQVASSGASEPIGAAVALPEVRATAGGVGGLVTGIASAVAAYAIGQLSVRLGLTSTLLWVVTGASGVEVLTWFAYYPVYRRDAARMQQVLTERLDELTADT